MRRCEKWACEQNVCRRGVEPDLPETTKTKGLSKYYSLAYLAEICVSGVRTWYMAQPDSSHVEVIYRYSISYDHNTYSNDLMSASNKRETSMSQMTLQGAITNFGCKFTQGTRPRLIFRKAKNE
jgi:hypothetical protein